jgi:uncharacterized membrane protein/mono/diheme cytochrome c family protein/YHS domain-containing protein
VSTPGDPTLFLGRLHPLLVHLPIGLIVLLAFLDLLSRSRRFQNANASTGFILALAVPTSLLTAGFGWLLSLPGGYDTRLLQWHQWTGIATAAACLLSATLYWLNLKRAYSACLWLTTACLVVASHYGGSLTHGSDYLTRYAPEPFRTWFGPPSTPRPAPNTNQPPADLPAFTSLVHPALEDKCVSCHGPEKAKGDLRLDTFEAILKGGSSGPALVAGKSADSEIVRRILLPEDHDDHMPPAGKPQLTADETALLKWWIDTGASSNKTIAELKPSPQIARILASRNVAAPAATEPTSVAPRPLAEVTPAAEQLAAELNLVITALSPTEPWLQCNASLAGTNFGNAELKKLASLGLNLRWLDLAGTGVNDDGLAQLAAMPNLTRLHLERTAISDRSLTQLSGLHQLEYLNLYGTQVTDEGLEPLGELPRLKQLYLWQTQVSKTGAEAFAKARVDEGQLQQWQEEIERLKTRIRDAQIRVELGIPLTTASTNSSPVNTQCPVSDKPVEATKTLVHEGATIAFCCDDCRAKFQQDPKAYLSKIQSVMPKPNQEKTSR